MAHFFLIQQIFIAGQIKYLIRLKKIYHLFLEMFQLCKEVKVYNIEYNYYLPRQKQPMMVQHHYMQKQSHQYDELKAENKGIKLPKQKKWLHLSMKDLQLKKLQHKDSADWIKQQTNKTKQHHQYKDLDSGKSNLNQTKKGIKQIHPTHNNLKKSMNFNQSHVKKYSNNKLDQELLPRDKSQFNLNSSDFNHSNNQIKINNKHNKIIHYKNPQKQKQLLCQPKNKPHCILINNKSQKMQIIDSYIEKSITKSIIMQQNNVKPSEKNQLKMEDFESPIKKLKKKMEMNRMMSVFQKQTLMSKQSRLLDERYKEIFIQSTVVQKEIKSQFKAISSSHSGYILKNNVKIFYDCYLGCQKQLGIILSIKQINKQQVQLISSQLLIYQELALNKIYLPSILQLYQSGINGINFILLKQPYTHTLQEYLTIISLKGNHEIIHEIANTISILIQTMNKYSIYVQRFINIHDFVTCIGVLKIHNLDIFTLDNSLNLSTKNIVKNLEQQLTAFFQSSIIKSKNNFSTQQSI